MQILNYNKKKGWKAAAIGKNAKNAKTFLEKRYNEEMEL
jgi:20S proteasome alpha/beta subunit